MPIVCIRLVFCMMLLGLGATSALAAPPLPACIPDDVMAVYFGRPSPEIATRPQTQGGVSLSTWLFSLKQMGVIPQEGRVIADIAGTIPMLGSRPHAVTLLDITVYELKPEVYRLEQLKAGLIVDVGEMGDDFDRRIRDLLLTYTRKTHNEIENRNADGVRYFRLVDDRLPEWAVAEWGRAGKLLIVGYGRGAFEKLLATVRHKNKSLLQDDWFAWAYERCHGQVSGIALYVDPTRINERLGPITEDRPAEVLQALKLQDAQRIFWTISSEGRALRSEGAALTVEDERLYGLLSGPELIADEVRTTIPPQADQYAAFRMPLAEFFRNGREAYLQSKPSEFREMADRVWAEWENDYRFDAERGLINQLGEHLIFHTFPRHPLRLPLICTIWIETTDDTETIRRTVDAMMQLWQRRLQRPPETQPNPAQAVGGLRPRIYQSSDSIWYMQLGVLGPSLAVTDGWIVISFSPYAVRQNVEYLQDLAPVTATQATP